MRVRGRAPHGGGGMERWLIDCGELLAHTLLAHTLLAHTWLALPALGDNIGPTPGWPVHPHWGHCLLWAISLGPHPISLGPHPSAIFTAASKTGWPPRPVLLPPPMGLFPVLMQVSCRRASGLGTHLATPGHT